MASLMNQRGRRSLTTSPAIPLPSVSASASGSGGGVRRSGSDVLDQWDIQLGSVGQQLAASQTHHHHHHGGSGHSPASAVPSGPGASRARALQQQQQQQQTTAAAAAATKPARFVKEQMIRAAVSAMIQCNVNVSPGLLDFKNKSDRELDETLTSVHAMLYDAQKPQLQQRQQQQQGPALEREIYFDPQLIGQQQSRPHAPTTHFQQPSVSSLQPHRATPHVSAQPSPMLRSTPTATATTTNLSGSFTPRGAGSGPSATAAPPFGSPMLGAMPSSSSSPTATTMMMNPFGSPVPATAQLQGISGNSGLNSSSATTVPHVVQPTVVTNLYNNAAQREQQQAHSNNNSKASNNNSSNNNTAGDEADDDNSNNSSMNSAAVKPKPHRAPYDPRLFPREIYDTVSATTMANVRKHIARSASSAFSQHSTQSSTLTQTAAPSPPSSQPRQDSDAFFAQQRTSSS